MLSFTEENYIKALLKITLDNEVEEVGTNELATQLEVKPATVTDMLKKLKEKKLISYEKYGKITLNDSGKKQALEILRKHRLWETFLFEKLDFSWDEVHEVAEQLEHIQSIKLINKLDKFLDYPKYDPHGDPIPDENGAMKSKYKTTLSEIKKGGFCEMVAVKVNETVFLQYVDDIGLYLGCKIEIKDFKEYDGLMQIEFDGKLVNVTQKFSDNIFVL